LKITTMKRRTFLKISTIAGGSLLVGCSFRSPKLMSTPQASEAELGLWVRIGNDNSITLILPSAEMGQHAHTGQAMLIAEELEVSLESVQVVTAPINSEYENQELFNLQRTDGSTSISAFWEKLRKVGAGTRIMLTTAGAKEWDVPVSECKADSGHIHHYASGRSLSYGKLALSASKLSPPDDLTLKNPDQFRLIGRSIPDIHTPSKSNGSAQFGIDVRRPGMVYAAVCQSPVFGGELKSYDKKAALSQIGVEALVPIPNGIAVVADSTWHAMKGLEVLNPKFIGGSTKGLNSKIISSKMRNSLENLGKADIKSEKFLDVEYELPYLHHATMEPMNCTAHVTSDFCEIWVPTQFQTETHKAAMEVTGFSENKVIVHTTLLGGGFGRRLAADFVVQAVMVSKELQKPVQVIWSREEDVQHGFYRTAYTRRFQVGLNDEGIPEQWESQSSQQNFMATLLPIFGWLNFDPSTIAGAVHDYPLLPKHFYSIEGVNVTHSPVDLGVPIGAWRAPINSTNVFFTESVMDELAFLSNNDPLDYRLKFLKNSPRHRSIIEQVALKSNWSEKLDEGEGRGISINEWFPFNDARSVVAIVAKVSVSKNGKLKVRRVDCVVDCGVVVNPDSVRSQMEGSIIMGMSAALFEEITLVGGHVAQSNFDDYRIARMRDTPEINVTIVDSKSDPTGAGEPASSPIVPAITNAIFAATGKRIRKLPIGKQKLV